MEQAAGQRHFPESRGEGALADVPRTNDRL